MTSVFPLSPESSRWHANDLEPPTVAKLPEWRLRRAILRLEQLSGNDVPEMSSIWFVGDAVLREWLIGELKQQRLAVKPYRCSVTS